MSTPHFVYDLPDLICSEASFAPHIPEGEAWQTVFTLQSSDDRRFGGSISSDNRRIIPASDTFSGTTPEITFGIDTKGLQVDDVGLF